MPSKRRLQKKTFHKGSAQNHTINSHIQAFANVEHELKLAYQDLTKHTKPNANLFTLAKDSQKIMMLLAEMRYLINQCKIARDSQKKNHTHKNRKKAA